MTEEKIGRDRIQQPGQPNENSANYQTLKNRFRKLLASKFSFSAKENKTMTNEEARQEGNQQQTPSNPKPGDPENKIDSATSADKAIEQFKGIKQALIGTEPEWILPEVNLKAGASKP